MNTASSKRIATGNFSIVVFSSLPTNPLQLIESFSRRLRKNNFNGWIAVGNWRIKSIDSNLRRRLKEAGVNYATHRLNSLCRILNFAAEFSNDAYSKSSELIEIHSAKKGIVNLEVIG